MTDMIYYKHLKKNNKNNAQITYNKNVDIVILSELPSIFLEFMVHFRHKLRI